ncbi:stealth conserved region 3 domain-containing protein [Glutamicibacter uratoxydans]|uniref:stealth family protein n=1 Tax=Glutamicibacter uratoxydans TaxID=43667 RepID=UPI003D6F99F0
MQRFSTLRDSNVQQTKQLADSLNLSYIQDPNSSTYCISQAHWQVLRTALLQANFDLQPVTHHSFAAASAWSISHGNKESDSRTGVIWQVFPGAIEPTADAQDFVGPIDIVYTWVDSQDPRWEATYREAVASQGLTTDLSATDLGRYTSRDELRYSLRSLEMYLPWVNHVYLVTAGQRPAWLDEAHPKLTLVDHEEIFTEPGECLPTFNSHAIESQLHNIPGLAEHFIYVNDDVFFGRYLNPNVFYGPAGQTKYCLTKGHFAEAEDPDLPVNKAAANNREVIVKRFERTTSRKFQHVAHPQRKQVHQEIVGDMPERIAEIARQRFRSPSDLSIPSSLAHQYAAQLGLGFPTQVAYQYVDIGSENFYVDILRLRKNKILDMFCINEVLQSQDAHRSKVVTDSLAGRFPHKSSFEL